MLKKTITYTDFNGEERTEDHYFHLSEAEVTEMELSEEGGMSTLIEKIIQEKDGTEIIKIFKAIVLNSYGVRSPDGRRFTKNDTIREEFESSIAYNKIFMELATNADKAAAFVNGIIPEGAMNDSKVPTDFKVKQSKSDK